jgi:two-component system nitrate/nitrite response regulator NarL
MIADDHIAIRAGVTSLIQGTEIELVCQAETSEQTLKHALACEPDVLLLDLFMPDGDGLRVLESIKRARPNLPVLIFSACDELKPMAVAHQLGADGFVLKGLPADELLRNIRRVASGKQAWTPRQIRQVSSRAAAEALAASDRHPLSNRERQVLEKIKAGCSNDLIAEELNIDVETVKQHVKHILRKLHLEDRTQAALWALRTPTV